jgi:hypothetical protein
LDRLGNGESAVAHLSLIGKRLRRNLLCGN